jgi:hypothetical protein
VEGGRKPSFFLAGFRAWGQAMPMTVQILLFSLLGHQSGAIVEGFAAQRSLFWKSGQMKKEVCKNFEVLEKMLKTRYTI